MSFATDIQSDFLMFDNVQSVTVVLVNVSTDATTTYTGVRALKRMESGLEESQYYLNHCRWHLYSPDLPLGVNPRGEIQSVSDGNWVIVTASFATLENRWQVDCKRAV